MKRLILFLAPWLVFVLLIVAVVIVMGTRAHGQFGVEQPFFAMTSTSQWTPQSIPDLIFWVNPVTNYVFTNNNFTSNVISDGHIIRSISNYATGIGVNLTNFDNTEARMVWYSAHNGNTNPCIWSENLGFKLRSGPAYTNTATEQWTFAVIRPTTVAGPYHYFWCSQTTPQYGLDNDAAANIYLAGDAGGSTLVTPSAGDLVWQLITVKFKTDAIIVRTNGVLANTSADWNFSGFNGFSLAGAWDSSVRYKGDIAELLHYATALTSNQVWEVETYLKNRHPFVYYGP